MKNHTFFIIYKKYDQNKLVHFSQIDVNSNAFIYRNALSSKNPSSLLRVRGRGEIVRGELQKIM